jgi:hypothetical protein
MRCLLDLLKLDVHYGHEEVNMKAKITLYVDVYKNYFFFKRKIISGIKTETIYVPDITSALTEDHYEDAKRHYIEALNQAKFNEDFFEVIDNKMIVVNRLHSINFIENLYVK